MNHLEDAAAQAGHAAGVSNSDPCIVPLAPGSNDSQCALDELDVSQQDLCSAEPCELDKPEYKTDEFRLYQFKIKQCTNEEAHDWCLCPFAHPGEKAQRRDPRLYKYTGISCPDYRKGTCKRGNACPYAHGVFEVWLHPSRYRTQTCKDAPHCTRQVCFFAHTLEEVRTVEPEDLPVLLEDGGAAVAVADAELPVVPESSSPPPKCGSNTNAKAAAAAKAKAAAAAAAAAAQAAGSVSGASAASSSSSSGASNGSSSSQTGSSVTSLTADPWMAAAATAGSGSYKGLSLMSRQASTCSTATTASQLGGLETVGSLNSALNAPALSLAAQQHAVLMQGAGNAGVASIAAAAVAAAAAAAGGNRLLQVPSDIALEAAALRAAAAAVAPQHLQQQQQLCDTFGSLDLGAFGAAGCNAGQWGAAAAASIGLPLQHLQLDTAGLGQHFGAAGDLALAAAAHQAVAAQHQEIQVMLQAAMVHQQHLASMQRHRDAMWTAAYNAAAGVGLNAATAAACADAAVQSTTEAADAAAAAAARSQQQQQQQQQLAVQQLLAVQQQQQQQQQLAQQLAAVTAPMPGAALTLQQLQHASSFGVIGGVGSGSPVPALGKLGSSGCLELDQQQQQQMAAAPMLMQQAGALAMHCEAFGGPKQLGGLINQAQGSMAPLQVSVTAGCGGAFGGL